MQEEEKSPVITAIVAGGVILIVVGTIAGIFNIGRSFSFILGIAFATYALGIVATLVLSSMCKDWSMTTQVVVGFIIGFILVLGSAGIFG